MMSSARSWWLGRLLVGALENSETLYILVPILWFAYEIVKLYLEKANHKLISCGICWTSLIDYFISIPYVLKIFFYYMHDYINISVRLVLLKLSMHIIFALVSWKNVLIPHLIVNFVIVSILFSVFLFKLASTSEFVISKRVFVVVVDSSSITIPDFTLDFWIEICLLSLYFYFDYYILDAQRMWTSLFNFLILFFNFMLNYVCAC